MLFRSVGAPYLRGRALAELLNARKLAGLKFYPITFTPTASKFSGQKCEGVFIVVTDRNAVRASRLGAELAGALAKLAPGQFQIDANGGIRLVGSAADLAKFKSGEDPSVIASAWSAAEARWRTLRAKYLLY